ncbi:hypothetical protein [Escherichia coli]|uniref:hypothetical protein n=1 Tax=Escherichia coli TaxID=562 RepID=UPI00128EA640|nr:hypothetical protein [Escherichia coli]MBM2952845.1 hypothetical protein [Escherichia coli]MQL42040.1 hypothetical protein [Escherichia coli]
MSIKLYGCSFVGNVVDFSFGSKVKVTCLDCGHCETSNGEAQGEPVCPECDSRNISIEPIEQEVK